MTVRAGGARRWLRLWHRWFGLAAGLWLILLAVTGSAIVFYEELDRWLNPELRAISGVSQGPPQAGRAIAGAQAALPGFVPRFVDLPRTPEGSILMIGSIPRSAGAPQAVQAFADPRDGAFLGWRASGTLSFGRRELMDTLYNLHMDLMLGEAMAWFLGLVALLWVLDHVPAILLALPRGATWRSAMLIRGRGLNLRRLFDLHRAPGIWFLPVTLTLAITGVSLAWHEEVRTVAGLVSPVSHRLHEDWPAGPPERDVGIDAAIAQVSQGTGGPVRSVLLLPRQRAYAVRTVAARDLDDMGRLWTYVAMADGRVLGQRHDNGVSGADTFLAWQYPLHSGKALGLAGRWLIFAAGLAVAMLCLTGFWLWARRARSGRARAASMTLTAAPGTPSYRRGRRPDRD